MNGIQIIVGAVVAVIIMLTGLIAYSLGKNTDKGARPEALPPPPKPKQNEAGTYELQAKLKQLDLLHDRYLSFILNIPAVITRLHATMKPEEIASTVVRLVGDLIPTDIVEFYTFDKVTDTLKRMHVLGDANPQPLSYKYGEGLVGRAGKDLMVRIKGHGDKSYSGQRDGLQEDTGLWLAAPIHFNKRLLGAIGIGHVQSPSGDERNLLKMISDIAAVTLVNAASLGEAQHEAVTDALTGLNNRRFFFDKTREFAEQAVLKGITISIFLFDIDNFKNYNDSNGHQEGDKLLKEISRLIKECTRKSSVVARYGGEEFIVMLPAISKEEAYTYSNRLRETIEKHPFAHREKQPLGFVSISGGVASFPEDGDSVQEVIKLADAALYQAKESGRNRVLKHEPYVFSDLSAEESELMHPHEPGI